jgi:hypothetical protein
MLLDGRDAVPRALAAFRESLSSGGQPYLWTLQDMRTVYDPVANQTTGFLRYEKWRDGGLVATELQRFRLQ